jgi:hypothetical protein
MITLECNYSKKLGLPGYSSHQFAITLRTEIADVNQVQSDSARLYKLLQDGVDTSIKETGYLPTNGNGNGQRGGQGSNRVQHRKRTAGTAQVSRKTLFSKLSMITNWRRPKSAHPTTPFLYGEWRTAAEKWAETGCLQAMKQRRAECAGLRD